MQYERGDMDKDSARQRWLDENIDTLIVVNGMIATPYDPMPVPVSFLQTWYPRMKLIELEKSQDSANYS